MRLSVLDFLYASDPVQAALNAASPGWCVYFPADLPYQAPAAGWKITKSLELYGDGPGDPETSTGSVIVAGGDASPVFDVVPPVQAVYLHDLQIRRNGAGTGSGSAIRCRSTQANKLARDVRMRRIHVQGFAGHGIHLEGFNTTNSRIEGVSLMEVTVKGCKGAGLYMTNVFDAFLMADAFHANQMNGVTATGGAVALYGCDFEGNCLLSSWSAQANPYEGNVKLNGCVIAVVDSCRIADFHLGNVKKGCVLIGIGGATLRLGNYSAGGAGSGATGITVTGSGSGPVAVIGNRFKGVPILVDIDSSIRDCVLLPQYDEDGIGAVNVPASPNQGMFGTPQVNVGPVGTTVGQPLIIPSGTVQDYAALKPGTLFYNVATDELRVCMPGAIKAVVTSP